MFLTFPTLRSTLAVALLMGAAGLAWGVALPGVEGASRETAVAAEGARFLPFGGSGAAFFGAALYAAVTVCSLGGALKAAKYLALLVLAGSLWYAGTLFSGAAGFSPVSALAHAAAAGGSVLILQARRLRVGTLRGGLVLAGSLAVLLTLPIPGESSPRSSGAGAGEGTKGARPLSPNARERSSGLTVSRHSPTPAERRAVR